MGILIDSKTRVVVQGITGRQGRFHTQEMLRYGTRIVAGVSPGKEGASVYGVPVFDDVETALREFPVDASIIFVPAAFAEDAAMEAIDSGIGLLVIITEHIPLHDTLRILQSAQDSGTIIVGPNTPGIIIPGRSKLGIMPSNIFTPGRVGVVSRSGTLTYEVVDRLTSNNLGQSTCVGIGGDPVIGTRFSSILEMFEADNATDIVVLIGEIGGRAEEEASTFIEKRMVKPVVAYIAGISAPPGKRMGHAGAIVEGKSGTAESKIKELSDAGVDVVTKPSMIPKAVAEASG